LITPILPSRGVVHQQVDLAEALRGHGLKVAQFVRLCHVDHLGADGIGAEGGGRHTQGVSVAVGHHHIHPHADQPPRSSKANAAGSTGDDSGVAGREDAI
jgi:hypothetical protein